MAFEKKPSTNSDDGIGSPEELDAYGVWVKSEPQDLTAGLAGMVDFDADDVPYGADFDTHFDDAEVPAIGMADDLDPIIPEMDPIIDDADTVADDDGHFDAEVAAPREQVSEEASTRLLMKIAGEISSIRTELNTLKKEFADIRAENASGAPADIQHHGFFAEDEDEKIALTGDEMENILTSSGLSDADDIPFDAEQDDAARSADEAALKEAEASSSADDDTNDEANTDEHETETAAAGDVPPAEEIKIDFDNLGINLDEDKPALEPLFSDEAAEPIEPDEPAETDADDDGFEAPAFDSLTFDEAAPTEEDAQEFEELVPLEEDADLRNLRLEGALPYTPAPDNTDYLEEDPFVLDNSDFEGTSLDENAADPVLGDLDSALHDTAVEDMRSDEPDIPETIVGEPDIVFDDDDAAAGPDSDALDGDANDDEGGIDDLDADIALDAAPLDIVDDIDADDTESAAPVAESAPEDDAPAEDLSFDEVEPMELSDDLVDEPDSAPDVASVDLSLDEVEPSGLSDVLAEDADGAPDTIDADFSLDDEEPQGLSGADTIDADFSLDDEEPRGLSGADTASGAAMDISFDTDLSLDDDDFSLDTEFSDVSAPLAPQTPDVDLSDISDPLADETFDTELSDSAEPAAEPLPEEPIVPLEDDAIDFSDAVIDEPDLSAGLVETPLEEPELGDITFDDDLSLDMDDLAGSLDTEPATASPATGHRLVDDSIAQVIPEGFETNAAEADVSLDDDLEAFGEDELAIVGEDDIPAEPAVLKPAESDVGGEVEIPQGMKTELKKVLSYMDHLLESLPEDKIEEFAQSEYFNTYKKIFKELGLV